VLRETASLKNDSHQIEGADLFERIADVVSDHVLTDPVRFAGAVRAFNLVVTNVPGPPFPMYMLGARLSHIYPLVPLYNHQGLGLALFSYCGKLCWGIAGDWAALPDLHDLVDDLQAATDELLSLAAEPAQSRASTPV